MVTISLDADDGQGNLDDAGIHSVSSRDECSEFMYNAWIRANVSSENYEFRVHASSTYTENFVEMGKYVVPARTNKVEIFAVDNTESIEEFDELGFSENLQKNLNDAELFWQRFDFLNNPNNHHLLLGKWLQLINEEIDLDELIQTATSLSDVPTELIGDSVLATLLSFSNQHGKSIEMLYWLVSKDGSHFLNNFDKWNDIPELLLDSALRTYDAMKNSNSKAEFIDKFLEVSLIPSIPLPVLK